MAAGVGELAAIVGWALLLLSLIGAAYTVAAGAAVSWFFARTSSRPTSFPAVTILKPLHGDEPDLRARLEGFCTQDYPAPVQIIFGVREACDPAIQIVDALLKDASGADIELVVDDRLYGSNLKVSNLINMERRIRHPVVVLADSDITVEADYLRRVVAALSEPGVGLATCVYIGKPTGSVWSKLSAMAIDYHFLPSVAFGVRTGLAKPCFGPTIAFRKTTLDQIGGFRPFVDYLADDYEIGRAVRKLGHSCAIPPFAIGHGCSERSMHSLVSHELRWARTLHVIDPLSYAGSVVCHPLPWAILAAIMLHGSITSLLTVLMVVSARLFTVSRVDRIADGKADSLWLLPVRDLLSLAIHLSAFLVRSVRWRGRRFRLGHKGILLPCEPIATMGEGSSRSRGWAPMATARGQADESDSQERPA